MALVTFFSGGSIERCVAIRDDAAALEQLWQDPASRVIAVWKSRCLVRGSEALLLAREDIGSDDYSQTRIYLGKLHDTHIFAIALPDRPEDSTPHSTFDTQLFENFRGLMGQLSATDAALLAYAKGMVEWQNRHRYCGVCGAANVPQAGGFAMECGDSGCGQRSFPRIDPAIIVLTTHNNHCLLGRQTGWPEGHYSTLAGFVEPGESLEDAVRREVQEESNIVCSNIHYLGSQPWPFPAAMMIGFHAQASNTEIRLNDGELADARWLTREQIAAGAVMLPPLTSIAFRLIEKWFNQWDGPDLETLGLSSSFSRSSGARN